MKRNMRRAGMSILAMLMLCMALVLSGCGTKELSDNVKVGTLVGPTGMGLVDLMDNEKVDVELYQSPTDVMQKLLSGDLDVACVPSNLGAVLYAKTGGNVQILTTVVNGVLYVVENGDTVKDVKDLKGKTIIASGQGGTPEYALQTVVEAAGLKLGVDVQVQWLENHADVAQKLATTPGAIALLPEPQVSALTAKSPKIRSALDMNSLWKDATGEELPMGILVAKKDFVENRADDVDVFLGLVDASVEDVVGASDEVVQKIVDAGIVPNAEICKAVIPNCSLVCMSADESKAVLSTFFEKLHAVNPMAVGGKVPGDDIYYGVK